MSRLHAFKILGIDNRASLREAKIAYHELVKRWHPDQFAPLDWRKPIAEEFLKQINVAYEEVQVLLTARQQPRQMAQAKVTDGNCPFSEAIMDGGRYMFERLSTAVCRLVLDCLESLKTDDFILNRQQTSEQMPARGSTDPLRFRSSSTDPQGGEPKQPTEYGHFDEVLTQVIRARGVSRE